MLSPAFRRFQIQTTHQSRRPRILNLANRAESKSRTLLAMVIIHTSPTLPHPTHSCPTLRHQSTRLHSRRVQLQLSWDSPIVVRAREFARIRKQLQKAQQGQGRRCTTYGYPARLTLLVPRRSCTYLISTPTSRQVRRWDNGAVTRWPLSRCTRAVTASAIT